MRATWILSVVAWLGTAAAHAQQEPTPVTEPAELTQPAAPEEAPPAAAPSQAEAAEPGAASTSTEDAAEPATRRRSAPQIGIAPGTPQTGTVLLTPPPEATVSETPSDGAWHFDFKGFLRAPMRLGFGSGDDSAPEAGQDGKLHSPPWIPDGTFTDWRYTNNLPGPWVELRFMYGNTRVTGNVMIAAYNITDGGYRNLQSQLGIDQAFVTIDAADLLEERGGLVWNVGVFQNR